MGRASREKGKRGERRWRDRLREEGFAAERTGWMQSRGGGSQVPDVQSPDLEIHFEVKTVERLSLVSAIEQATADADGAAIAVVWQPSRREPIIAMPASDWFKAVRGDLVKDDQKEGADAVAPTPSNENNTKERHQHK